MTARIRLGVKGSPKGLWVSKPGYNVSTANPGDMLFDSSAQVYQVVKSGTMFIQNCYEAYPSPLPPGWTPSVPPTVTRTLNLGIGSYSNVALWFDIVINILYNASDIPSSTYIEEIQQTLDLRARISNGVLIFTALNVRSYDSQWVQPQVNSNWFAFRSQYA